MHQRQLSIPVLWILFALAATSLADQSRLNRSIYVPVRFVPCEHVADAMLYRDESVLGEVPGRHVFQFTYFPNLGRIEPAYEEVTVEGTVDGKPFKTGVVVTPTSVYGGKSRVALDLEAQRARFARHVDARHETVRLTFRCSASCPREVARAEPRSASFERP